MFVRALDHFAISVHDVEASGAKLEALGFQVLPTMRHIEVGSCNRVVQLHDSYLEVVGDLDKSLPALRDRMMPRFACGEGLSIVSLDSGDLEADRLAVERAGLEPTAVLNARRRVPMSDGSEAETDSRCFYVWRPDRLYSTLFLTQHFRPEVIWHPPYMTHPNGAIRTIGISYVSDAPELDAAYGGKLLGAVPRPIGRSVVLTTRRGEFLEYLPPDALADRFPGVAPTWCRAQPCYGVALKIRVADLRRCEARLRANRVPASRSGSVLRVPADVSAGVVFEFVE
jgi:hypothetical protein